MSIHVFDGEKQPQGLMKVKGISVDKNGIVRVEDSSGNKWFVDKDTYIQKEYQPDINMLPVE